MNNRIKVYNENNQLEDIEITNPPTKIKYTEGENFNKTGMKVIAKYDNNTSQEITNYKVEGGEGLTVSTTSVIISYTENKITKTKEQKMRRKRA